MRFRSRAPANGAESSERRERIQRDLARLGVAAELRDELSRRLEALAPNLTEEGYDAALAGVALAHGVTREDGRPSRSRREFEELQRLLAGFSDELRKVDEALRILGAYVRRMRTRTTSGGARTVH